MPTHHHVRPIQTAGRLTFEKRSIQFQTQKTTKIWILFAGKKGSSDRNSGGWWNLKSYYCIKKTNPRIASIILRTIFQRDLQ